MTPCGTASVSLSSSQTDWGRGRSTDSIRGWAGQRRSKIVLCTAEQFGAIANNNFILLLICREPCAGLQKDTKQTDGVLSSRQPSVRTAVAILLNPVALLVQAYEETEKGWRRGGGICCKGPWGQQAKFKICRAGPGQKLRGRSWHCWAGMTSSSSETSVLL